MDFEVVDGTLYVATTGSLHAFDPQSGDEHWQTTLPKDGDRVCYAPPLLVTEERLYVSGCRGTFAFDAATGKKLWQAPEPARVMNMIRMGDRLYCSRGSQLTALRVSNGSVVWKRSLSEHINDDFYGPVSDGERFYYAVWRTHEKRSTVITVEPATARIHKERELGNLPLNSLPTLTDDGLYVATGHSMVGEYKQNTLFALDPTTLEVEWESTLRAVYTPVAVENGRVVAVTHDSEQPYLRSFDAASGEKQWTHTFDVELNPHFSQPRVDDGRIYLGGNRDQFQAIDAESGTAHWTFSPPGIGDARPATFEDLVFIPGGSRVWALETTSD